MTDEKAQAEDTTTEEQSKLKAAIAHAKKILADRSYSERHPELGKMFNCPVHGFRHRVYEFGGCAFNYAKTNDRTFPKAATNKLRFHPHSNRRPKNQKPGFWEKVVADAAQRRIDSNKDVSQG